MYIYIHTYIHIRRYIHDAAERAWGRWRGRATASLALVLKYLTLGTKISHLYAQGSRVRGAMTVRRKAEVCTWMPTLQEAPGEMEEEMFFVFFFIRIYACVCVCVRVRACVCVCV